MKALIRATLAAAVAISAVPSLAFAQATTAPDTTNAPITRAEVRADLIRVEQAGYRPSDSDINYPADIQAAEARIHSAPDADHSYGGTANDSAAGTTTTAPANTDQ
jgi:hypothetical protein